MPARMSRSTRSKATRLNTSPCTRARRCTGSIERFTTGRDRPRNCRTKTMGATIWTIGHSTRPIDAFLELLAHYRLEAVVDVRRFPGSRRHPQYTEAVLSAALTEHGIAYRW